MQTVVIIGARPVSRAVLECIGAQNPYIIAVDAGWQQAEKLGLTPDLILGDFDSAPRPERKGLLVSPAEKDDTDTMLAIYKALELGAQRVVILGGLGGRPDHSFANIQGLLHLARRGVQAILADENTQMYCLAPGELSLPARVRCYLSVFAVGGNAEGVDLGQVKYPLHNATLTPDYPLGVSNEFESEEAVIRHSAGYLLVMVTPMDGEAK